MTILTAPEPQTQLMAMVLVLAMNALAARADAPVLLDGVTAAAADAMGAAIVAPGTTVTSF